MGISCSAEFPRPRHGHGLLRYRHRAISISAASSTLGVALRNIAIVGMGCRFPGARNLPEYWRMLRKGERQFRTVPPERWDHAPIHTPQDRRARAGTYTD